MNYISSQCTLYQSMKKFFLATLSVAVVLGGILSLVVPSYAQNTTKVAAENRKYPLYVAPLGMQLKVPFKLKGLTYAVKKNTGLSANSTMVVFSTTILAALDRAQGGKECGPGALGAIIRGTKLYDIEGKERKMGENDKKIGKYYYTLVPSQSICNNEDKITQELQQEQAGLLAEVFKNLK